MTAPRSPNQWLPPDVLAGPVRPTLPSSSWDVPADISCTPNTPEYTETDFLLPVALYGVSRARGTGTAPAAGAPRETVFSMLVQISVPFLLAGLGTVFAGLLLEVVQVRQDKGENGVTI